MVFFLRGGKEGNDMKVKSSQQSQTKWNGMGVKKIA